MEVSLRDKFKKIAEGDTFIAHFTLLITHCFSSARPYLLLAFCQFSLSFFVGPDKSILIWLRYFYKMLTNCKLFCILIKDIPQENHLKAEFDEKEEIV